MSSSCNSGSRCWIRDLVVVDETAYCLGYAKDVGVLTLLCQSEHGCSCPSEPGICVELIPSFTWRSGHRYTSVWKGGRRARRRIPGSRGPRVCHSWSCLTRFLKCPKVGNRWYVGCMCGRLNHLWPHGWSVVGMGDPGRRPSPQQSLFSDRARIPSPHPQKVVVILTMGLYLRHCARRSTATGFKVPNRGPLTMTMPTHRLLSNPEAWNALGVRPGAER